MVAAQCDCCFCAPCKILSTYPLTYLHQPSHLADSVQSIPGPCVHVDDADVAADAVIIQTAVEVAA